MISELKTQHDHFINIVQAYQDNIQQITQPWVEQYTKYSHNFIHDFVTAFSQAIGKPNATKVLSPNTFISAEQRKPVHGRYEPNYVSDFITGPKFGVMFSNKGVRKVGSYFSNDELFLNLTKDHVELIKTAKKRQIGRDFLATRDCLLKELKINPTAGFRSNLTMHMHNVMQVQMGPVKAFNNYNHHGVSNFYYIEDEPVIVNTNYILVTGISNNEPFKIHDYTQQSHGGVLSGSRTYNCGQIHIFALNVSPERILINNMVTINHGVNYSGFYLNNNEISSQHGLSFTQIRNIPKLLDQHDIKHGSVSSNIGELQSWQPMECEQLLAHEKVVEAVNAILNHYRDLAVIVHNFKIQHALQIMENGHF